MINKNLLFITVTALGLAFTACHKPKRFEVDVPATDSVRIARVDLDLIEFDTLKADAELEKLFQKYNFTGKIQDDQSLDYKNDEDYPGHPFEFASNPMSFTPENILKMKKLLLALKKEGIVTNKRTEDWAYSDTKFMEKLLRNAVKINGFWIMFCKFITIHYIDDCVLTEIPDCYHKYFDTNQFIDDAERDGRGHSLNGWDGSELDYTLNGTTYYAYRQ